MRTGWSSGTRGRSFRRFDGVGGKFTPLGLVTKDGKGTVLAGVLSSKFSGDLCIVVGVVDGKRVLEADEDVRIVERQR